MSVASVLCPHCGVAFDAIVADGEVSAIDKASGAIMSQPTQPTHPPQPHRSQTLRSLQATNVPVRGDRAPICRRCGLVGLLHDGKDSLAMTRYGCDAFQPRHEDDAGEEEEAE